MKVICVNEKWKTIRGRTDTVNPVYGQIYTVIGSKSFLGYNFYLFSELEGYFEQSAFIPVSDIDETTFERNYNKAAV